MVRYLASAELMYGNASVMNSQLERMSRITADELREVVQRFIRTDNMKTFYILPTSAKDVK
jgi:predicted Zn-dependent peptidase